VIKKKRAEGRKKEGKNKTKEKTNRKCMPKTPLWQEKTNSL